MENNVEEKVTMTATERIQERLLQEIEYYFTEKNKQERQDRVKESMVISKLASNYIQYETTRIAIDRLKLGQKENIRKRKRYEK